MIATVLQLDDPTASVASLPLIPGSRLHEGVRSGIAGTLPREMVRSLAINAGEGVAAAALCSSRPLIVRWPDEGGASWYVTVGPILCLELHTLLTEYAPASRSEVMPDKLVRKLLVAAAWRKERLVRHAVVVQLIQAVAAVVMSAGHFDNVVRMRAVGAGRAGDVLRRLSDVFDAVLPLFQRPAICLADHVSHTIHVEMRVFQ